MENNFVKKIKEFWNREEEKAYDNADETEGAEPTNAETRQETKNDPEGRQDSKILKGDGVSTKMALIHAIANKLMAVRYLKNDCETLQLFVHGFENIPALELLLQNKDFEQELRRELTNARINLGTGWRWQYFVSEPPEKAESIDDGLWLFVGHRGSATGALVKTAAITALKGLLTEKEISLVSDKKYNIGRGANPQLENGKIHENQIIVANTDADGITEEDRKLNQYVSRAHAYITGDNAGNFVLSVYEGGTIVKNNRTRVSRNDVKDPIDLTNIYSQLTLQDGDIIELGKSVQLKFHITNS